MAVVTLSAAKRMRSGNRTIWTYKFNSNGDATVTLAHGLKRRDSVLLTTNDASLPTFTDSSESLAIAGMTGTDTVVSAQVIGY